MTVVVEVSQRAVYALGRRDRFDDVARDFVEGEVAGSDTSTWSPAPHPTGARRLAEIDAHVGTSLLPTHGLVAARSTPQRATSGGVR
jgi:hypothetical protein